MHLSRYLAHWARYTGSHPYMHCAGETLDWRTFHARAGAVAATLQGWDIGGDARIGCLLPNGLEWCVTFGASIRLGTTLVPLNPMFGRFELEQIVADSGCAAIISTAGELARIGIAAEGRTDEIALFEMAPPHRRIAFAAAVAQLAPLAPVAYDDAALLVVCYTSGTTGMPKGVALSHRAVERMAIRVGMRFGWRSGEERFLVLAPLAFTGGVVSSLAAHIVAGGTGWLERQVDPNRVLPLLTENRITTFSGVPALWERIAAADGFADADLAALSGAGTGGAPVSRELVAQFGAKGVVVRQLYGTSEHCGAVTCPDLATAIADPASCGPPLPGVELEIRDEAGRVVAAGEVGEIALRSGQLMDGYWQRPEETAAAFIDGWYHTGDLGRLGPNGDLYVVDRKKNMIISGGVNIYPAEIERAMATIHGVAEVAVIGVPSVAWGEEAVAIVHAPAAEPARLHEQVRALLGGVKAPKRVVLSPDPLPRTASNKIARAELDAVLARLS